MQHRLSSLHAYAQRGSAPSTPRPVEPPGILACMSGSSRGPRAPFAARVLQRTPATKQRRRSLCLCCARCKHARPGRSQPAAKTALITACMHAYRPREGGGRKGDLPAVITARMPGVGAAGLLDGGAASPLASASGQCSLWSNKGKPRPARHRHRHPGVSTIPNTCARALTRMHTSTHT